MTLEFQFLSHFIFVVIKLEYDISK